VAPDGPFHVVINPASGAGEAAHRHQAIAQALRKAGRRAVFARIDSPGDCGSAMMLAARQASEDGGALVAVGGDGTLTTGAQAALAAGCPLGIVAQGTFNYFAREHGFPQDLDNAARALAHAQEAEVQAAEVNGRVFLVNASLGLYPHLLHDREGLTRQFGRHRWVAALGALATLYRWRWQLSLEFEADGEQWVLRTPTLFVANNRLQLSRLGMDDSLVHPVGRGRLAAVFPKPIGTRALASLALRGALGRLGEADQVNRFTFQRLTVRLRSIRRTVVAADGEVGMMSQPITFSVCDRPLRLLVPRPQDRVAIQ
jgi:diacylglycerol kinase family enzyme